MFGLYAKSIGRGANLLLNVPPNRQGRFSSPDSAALIGFKAMLDKAFKTELLKVNAVVNTVHLNKKSVKRRYLGYNYVFKEPIMLNCMVLEEDITSGQAISSLIITVSLHGEVQQSIAITTVGHWRMVCFPNCSATEVSVVVTGAKNLPYLKNIAAYQIPDDLFPFML